MLDDVTRRELPGNWRRRIGNRSRLAHVYRDSDPTPRCQKRIPRDQTSRVDTGYACTDCLVAAITARP